MACPVGLGLEQRVFGGVGHLAVVEADELGLAVRDFVVLAQRLYVHAGQVGWLLEGQLHRCLKHTKRTGIILMGE